MARAGRCLAPLRRSLVLAAAICAATAIGPAGFARAPAAQPSQDNLFLVRVESQGSFGADYGDERLESDSRGFGTDGVESFSWHWEAEAVAKGPARGDRDLVRKAGRLRSVAFVNSSKVEYDHLGGPSGGQLREFPACEPSPLLSKQRTADPDDDSVPSRREVSRGAWVQLGALSLSNEAGLQLGSPVGQAVAIPECFGHEDLHGLKFEKIGEGEADLPRNRFDPTGDDRLEETFRSAFDKPRDHDGIAPAYHTAVGQAVLKLSIRRLPRDAWRKRLQQYRDSPRPEVQSCPPGADNPDC